MDSTEEGKSSWSAMDSAQEARCKEMLDQILAMVMKMRSDLEACKAAFRTAPPAFVAGSDSSGSEVEATSGIGYNSVSGGSALTVHSAPASPIPSPTSAPPHDADLVFQSGVTEFCYTRDPPVSTHDDLCIPFDADDRDVDRLSRLPNSLLHDIVARLPIKDAGRTAVLSRRWSHIWRAAPLLVGHADFAVNSDHFYVLVPKSPDGLLEQIRLQQEGHARPLLANDNPYAYTAARAWRPPWFCASRSTPFRWCCSPSREPVLELLIRPYDPGAGFIGGTCIGVYLDTKEAEHARVKISAMGLLPRSIRIWPAELRTGIGTMLDAADAVDDPSADPTSLYILVARQDSWSVTTCTDGFVEANCVPVTGASFLHVPLAITKFLSGKHTRCSVQGHGNNVVTTLNLCAFTMIAVAIKGTLHHEEMLWILLLLEPEKLLSSGTLRLAVIGVFKDWQQQPWPPPMFVEILDSQVEGNITELRPNPWPSFEYFVSQIHGVSYMLLSCDINLQMQQLGNLLGFSSIWHVSILNLSVDLSKCRVQWKPPWVSYVGRNFAGRCRFIMVFPGQNVVTALLMLVQARFLITCLGIELLSMGFASLPRACAMPVAPHSPVLSIGFDGLCFSSSFLDACEVFEFCHYYISADISMICPLDTSNSSWKSYGLLHNLSHGESQAISGTPVLFMSKFELKGVNMADKNGMHSVPNIWLFIVCEWDGSEKSFQAPLLLKSPWPPPTQDEGKGSGIDHWSVHYLSFELSNGAGLLLPQPFSLSALQFHKCLFVLDHTIQWKNDSGVVQVPFQKLNLLLQPKYDQTSKVTGLNSYGSAIPVKPDTSRFLTSRLTLLLLLREHSKESSCHISALLFLSSDNLILSQATSHLWSMACMQTMVCLRMAWCFHHSKQEVIELKPPWPPPAWICSFGAEQQFVDIDRNYCYLGSELSFSTWKDADQILHQLSLTRQHVLYIVNKEQKLARNTSTNGANTLCDLWLVSMLYDQDKEVSLRTNTAKSILKEGSESHIQVWNAVSLTLTTTYLQVLWDPGGLFHSYQAMDLTLVIHLQERLGGKPCFKEGSMSGTYSIWAGPTSRLERVVGCSTGLGPSKRHGRCSRTVGSNTRAGELERASMDQNLKPNRRLRAVLESRVCGLELPPILPLLLLSCTGLDPSRTFQKLVC